MSRRDAPRGALSRAVGRPAADAGEKMASITADAHGGMRLVPAVKASPAGTHEAQEVSVQTSFLGLNAQDDPPAVRKRRHAYHTVGSGYSGGGRHLAPDEGGKK